MKKEKLALNEIEITQKYIHLCDSYLPKKILKKQIKKNENQGLHLTYC